MKAVKCLFFLSIMVIGCSSPKKTPAKETGPKVTRADIMRGGTSYSNPVVILVKSEAAGLEEEYKWLRNIYPGYGLIRRTQSTKGGKHFDIVRIKTRQGALKDVYFDSTSFWRP